MSSFKNRIRSILRSKAGETLMEGIASILVFTVLVASITTMIMLSLRITQRSTEDSGRRQSEANAVLTGIDDDFDLDSDNDNSVIFTSAELAGMEINIRVTVNTTENFIAFSPLTGTGGEGGGP